MLKRKSERLFFTVTGRNQTRDTKCLSGSASASACSASVGP